PLAGRVRRVPVRGLRGDDRRGRPRLGAGLHHRRRRGDRALRLARRVPELSPADLRRHPDRLHALHARWHRARARAASYVGVPHLGPPPPPPSTTPRQPITLPPRRRTLPTPSS